MPTDKLPIRSWLTATCMVGALIGCASTPDPSQQLAVGKASIEAAQSAGATELAPLELNRAREKWHQAVAAARAGQLVLARRLAEEADADAQVARTRTEAERARQAADEVTAGLQTLRSQLGMPGGAAGSDAQGPDADGQRPSPAMPSRAQPTPSSPTPL